MSNSRTLSDFVGSSGTPTFSSNTTFTANVAVTGAATFTNTATFNSATTLSIGNQIPGIYRQNNTAVITAGQGVFVDSTSTGDRSILAIRTGNNNSVPFSMVEAGALPFENNTPYGVLNLCRVNHANASPTQAGMFFETKAASGAISEWGGIAAGRTVTDGADDRGSLYLYAGGRTLAATYDYKGRMINPKQPACVCSIGDNGSSRSVSVTANQIIAVYPHNDTDSNVASNRFTAPVAGIYHFSYNVEIQGTASGRFGIVIRKNGAQFCGSIEYFQAGSGNWQNASASGNIYLAKNDYVELWTENVPAGAIVWYASATSGSSNGNFSMFLIG